MNNEYRIAKGWRIFLHAVLPLFAAGLNYMGLSPFLEPPSNKSMYVVLPLLAVVLCALIAWGYVDLYRAKLVLEDNRVVQVSAFSTKELPAALVKGFSEEQNYVVLHPAEEGR